MSELRAPLIAVDLAVPPADLVVAIPLIAPIFPTLVSAQEVSAFGPGHAAAFGDARKCAADNGVRLVLGIQLWQAFDVGIGQIPNGSVPFDPTRLCDWRGWDCARQCAERCGEVGDEHFFLDWERSVRTNCDDPAWSESLIRIVADVARLATGEISDRAGCATINYDMHRGGYAPHDRICRQVVWGMRNANADIAFLAAIKYRPGMAGPSDADAFALNPPGTMLGSWLGASPAFTPQQFLAMPLLSRRWAAVGSPLFSRVVAGFAAVTA